VDKGSKRKVYARTGVKELWLVDQNAKLIHVYQLAKDAETPAANYDEKAVFGSPLLRAAPQGRFDLQVAVAEVRPGRPRSQALPSSAPLQGLHHLRRLLYLRFPARGGHEPGRTAPLNELQRLGDHLQFVAHRNANAFASVIKGKATHVV